MGKLARKIQRSQTRQTTAEGWDGFDESHTTTIVKKTAVPEIPSELTTVMALQSLMKGLMALGMPNQDALIHIHLQILRFSNGVARGAISAPEDVPCTTKDVELFELSTEAAAFLHEAIAEDYATWNVSEEAQGHFANLVELSVYQGLQEASRVPVILDMPAPMQVQ